MWRHATGYTYRTYLLDSVRPYTYVHIRAFEYTSMLFILSPSPMSFTTENGKAVQQNSLHAERGTSCTQFSQKTRAFAVKFFCAAGRSQKIQNKYHQNVSLDRVHCTEYARLHYNRGGVSDFILWE